jgi:hypothetical protein
MDEVNDYLLNIKLPTMKNALHLGFFEKCFTKISTRNKSYYLVQNKLLLVDFLNLYIDFFRK